MRFINVLLTYLLRHMRENSRQNRKGSKWREGEVRVECWKADVVCLMQQCLSAQFRGVQRAVHADIAEAAASPRHLQGCVP